MKLIEDYQRIRESFPNITERQSCSISMSELAALLFCTQRNAKIILNKMLDHEWISFKPGKGRGNRSTLMFLQTIEDILKKEAENMVIDGNLEGAFRLIRDFGDDLHIKEQFLKWLSHYFGYFIDKSGNKYAETLRLPVYRLITTLDPAESFYALDSHIMKQIYSTLVEYDHDEDKIIPSIAHYWEVNERSTEWIFFLRKGVLFHNKKELHAYDVKYSFERLPDSKSSWIVEDIKSIEILSKYAIKIILHRPNTLFLHFLSYVPASILPANEKKYSSIGNGPYQVERFHSGTCILKAFDQYFQGRAFIDQIEILTMPELNDEWIYKNDFNMLMVQTDESKWLSQTHWITNEKICGSSVMTLNLNKKGPLQDIKFRKALHHLINRQQLVLELGNSRVCPSSGFDLQLHDLGKDPDFDCSLGKNMLEESIYKGESIQLFTYKRHALDAYWIKRIYQKYDINIEINILPWKDMLNEEITKNADIVLFEAVTSEGIIRQIEYFKSNFSFVKSHLNQHLLHSIHELIGKALEQANADGIHQTLHTIEKNLKQNFALIFLAKKTVSTLSHPYLINVKVNPRGWVDFKHLWFKN